MRQIAVFTKAQVCFPPQPPTTPAQPTARTTVACEEPYNDEQHDGTDGSVDHQRDRSNTKMNAESRQQPITNKRSDNSDDQVSDEPKSTASNDLTGNPPRSNADDYCDDEAFVRKVHAAR
jgi:hypothetical protein